MSVSNKLNITKPGTYRRSENLYLHVQKKNDRIYEYWAFRYWDGQRKRHITLGSTKKVSITQARNKVLELRTNLLRERNERDADNARTLLGLPPRPEATKPPEQTPLLNDDSPTYEDAIKAFLELKVDEVGAKSLNDWTTSLNTFTPKFGKKRVSLITVDHIESVLKPIWREKTYMSNRSLMRLASFFEWARALGYCHGDNPAAWKGNLVYRLPNPNKLAKTKSYPALPWDQAHDFFKDLDQRDTLGAIALKLIVLTGQRSGQIRKAQWSHVNFKEKTWVFPAEHMKKRVAHTISIDDNIIKILKKIPKTGHEELFNPKGTGPISDVSVSKVIRDMNKAREKSGLPIWHDPSDGRAVNPHGFRTTFRVWGADKQHDRQALEFQLAHKIKDKVEAAYNRSNLLEIRRRIMSNWTDLVVNGK